MFSRCVDCGSFWGITVCLKTKKPLCRSCCDDECGEQFMCWGQYCADD